jgi:hypothetical protein
MPLGTHSKTERRAKTSCFQQISSRSTSGVAAVWRQRCRTARPYGLPVHAETPERRYGPSRARLPAQPPKYPVIIPHAPKRHWASLWDTLNAVESSETEDKWAHAWDRLTFTSRKSDTLYANVAADASREEVRSFCGGPAAKCHQWSGCLHCVAGRDQTDAASFLQGSTGALCVAGEW